MTFTLRPLRSEGYSRGVLTARLESWDNRRIEVPMLWTGLDGQRDMFTASLNTNGYMGLIWYSFRLERLDGKSGKESREYQLTVYDENDRVPRWFGEGMAYQIFPDRFCRLTVPNPAGMVGYGGRYQDQPAGAGHEDDAHAAAAAAASQCDHPHPPRRRYPGNGDVHGYHK